MQMEMSFPEKGFNRSREIVGMQVKQWQVMW